MSTTRVATLVAILGGILLGSLAASFTVSLGTPTSTTPEHFDPPFEPVAAIPGSVARRPAPELASDPPELALAPSGSAVAPAGSAVAPSPATIETEGPLPPWLENQIDGGTEAVTQAALSCARGNADDCMRAGDAYDAGRGVTPNERQARLNRVAGARLFDEACKRRKPEACYSLSVIYSLGLGVKRNPEIARGHMTIARNLCKTVPADICQHLPEFDGAE